MFFPFLKIFKISFFQIITLSWDGSIANFSYKKFNTQRAKKIFRAKLNPRGHFAGLIP